MEAEALKQLQQLIAATVGKVGTHVPSVVLPSDMSVKSLEHLQAAPSRFRGRFSTDSITDFLKYNHGIGAAEVFVDPDSLAAESFFDLGEPGAPGHGDHSATIKLKKTAPFHAVTAMDGENMSQRNLYEWLVDWEPHLAAIGDNGEVMNKAQAINSVRTVTIESKRSEDHEDGNMRGRRSAMEEVEAKSREQFPAFFDFTCTPYLGLSERTFRLRLAVSKQENQAPRLSLRIIALEAAEEAMAQEFKDKLADGLNDAENETYCVFVGRFSKSK